MHFNRIRYAVAGRVREHKREWKRKTHRCTDFRCKNGKQKSVYRRHSLAVPMYTPPRYIFLSFSVLIVDLFDLDHVLIVYSEMASSRIEMDGWCRGVV